MPSFAGIAAPLALMLPMLGAGTAAGNILPFPDTLPEVTPASHAPETEALEAEKRALRQTTHVSGRVTLDALLADMRTRQIRIEQRVIVRITPQRNSNRRSLLAELPQRALNTRYEERKAGECIALEDIAGVQTGSGNRLLLFLREREIMSLNLEKACRARDFYSGFYVERSEDGKICINRDELQSRNGARCEIDRMMELVAIED